ncbi:MAG: hypothetical protein NVSMB19_09760 [Vulcanimicrobiaceae bacterium]
MLRELVQAQRRFPSLFARLNEPEALFQLDGTLVQANGAARTLLAGTAPRALGEIATPLPECGRLDVREAFRSAAAGATVSLPTTIAHGDGTSTCIAVCFSPAVVENVIVGVHATGRDITHERDASQRAERKINELMSLFERHTDAMLAVDANGRCSGLNPAGERITGYTSAELRGQPFDVLIAPDILAHTIDVFARAMHGETVSERTAIRTRTGERVDITGIMIPIVVDGAVVGVYAVGRDMTEQHRFEREARVQAERVRELYLVAAASERTAESQIRAALALGAERLACEGGYITRIENNTVTYLYGTGDVEYVTGKTWPLDQSLHRHVASGGRPYSVDDVAALPPEAGLTTLARAARSFIGTPLLVGGDPFGSLCFVSRSPRKEKFTDADRDFVRLIGTLASSAIDRGDQRQRLDTLAFFDALTGLPNRVLLSDRLMQAIATSQRDGSLFAVHFYDLDGFKHINDEHGHSRGDDVLRLVAKRFERVARDIDTVARVGGDEFVVVQPGVHGMEDAVAFARRLREAIGEPFIVDGRERSVSASGGIALHPKDGADAATLIARADAALYRVKGSGRNNVAFVTAGDATP